LTRISSLRNTAQQSHSRYVAQDKFRGADDCEQAHFRLWHKTDLVIVLRNVRFRGRSGKHMLRSSFSGFDPTRTLTEKSRMMAGILNGWRG
jgi:hypothetical protein